MNHASRRKPPLSDPGPPLSPLPPPAAAPRGAWRFALPLLLVAYLSLAITHALVVPTGQTGYQNAPDEAAHVAYVRSLASGHLPTQWEPMAPSDMARIPAAAAYEWHQPPLYYGLAALFLGFGERGLRTASILCGLVDILLLYRVGRMLFPDDPRLATVAAGIDALTPSHIALTSTVNNDALLEVCFSTTLLLLIASLHGGFTRWRAGWLGVALGAALMTKATGLLLLPIVLFALFLLWRGGDSPRDLWRGAGWTLLVLLLISGWWFVRNVRLYQELLPLRAFAESFRATVTATDVVQGQRGPALPTEGWAGYLLLGAQWTFQSFWAVYGTPRSATVGAPRFLPAQVYWLMSGASLAALVGLGRLYLQRKASFTETQRLALRILLATVGVVGLSFTAFVSHYFQMQGRYLYPAMLPLCLLFALGWRALFPPRYRSIAGGILLAVLFALALALVQKVISV